MTTRFRVGCASNAGRPLALLVTTGRTGEARSRSALRQPVRPQPTLRWSRWLDIGWELNGAEFQSQSHYRVLDRGIGHVYIKPATPRLNGVVIDDTDLFNDRLQEWET